MPQRLVRSSAEEHYRNMEVPLEVAQWLHRLQLLPSPSPTLPAELSASLARVLLPTAAFLLTGWPHCNVPALSPISTAPTPAAKLTNWSTVFKACTALEVKVTEEQRLLILAGDHQSVINLFSSVCQAGKRWQKAQSRRRWVAVYRVFGCGEAIGTG